jgi:hypothetical protein
LPKIKGQIGIEAFAGCTNIETPLILLAEDGQENVIIRVPGKDGNEKIYNNPLYFTLSEKTPYILMSNITY